MVPQLRYKRKWKDVTWGVNPQEVIDLPRDYDLESIHLYLWGSINVTAAYASIMSEGLSKLIRRVELLANGETIATIPGTFLVHGNFARNAGVIKVNPGIAIANYAGVEAVGFLDQALVGALRPKDSNLHVANMPNLQLRIVWGAIADMYTGAGACTPALICTVSLYQSREQDHAKLPEVRRAHKYILDGSFPVASNNFRLQLDPNVLARGIVLRAENAGELSTAVINNIKVMYGSDVIIDMPAQALADANTQDNGFAMTPGYYLVDFSPAQGRMAKISDFLNTYPEGNQNAWLILDVNGAAGYRVQGVAHEFEWLPANQAFNRELEAAEQEAKKRAGK